MVAAAPGARGNGGPAQLGLGLESGAQEGAEALQAGRPPSPKHDEGMAGYLSALQYYCGDVTVRSKAPEHLPTPPKPLNPPKALISTRPESDAIWRMASRADAS